MAALAQVVLYTKKIVFIYKMTQAKAAILKSSVFEWLVPDSPNHSKSEHSKWPLQPRLFYIKIKIIFIYKTTQAKAAILKSSVFEWCSVFEWSEPFDYRLLKRSVFEWIRNSNVRYSSPDCTSSVMNRKSQSGFLMVADNG